MRAISPAVQQFSHQDLEGAARGFRSRRRSRSRVRGWMGMGSHRQKLSRGFRTAAAQRGDAGSPGCRRTCRSADDPDLASGHLALGIVRLQYDWEWADARSEFDRALQLAPGCGPGAALDRPVERCGASSIELGVRHASEFADPPFPRGMAGGAGRQCRFRPANSSKMQRIYSRDYVSPAIALLALKVHDPDNLFVWLNADYRRALPRHCLMYIWLRVSRVPIHDMWNCCRD